MVTEGTKLSGRSMKCLRIRIEVLAFIDIRMIGKCVLVVMICSAFLGIRVAREACRSLF